MKKKHILPQFYELFKLLAANNNREWFMEHKNEFEKYVFMPFKRLTEEVIFLMQRIDPAIHIIYKDAAFRFYRDIRFSQDKSPYKLWMGAVVNRIGRKNTRYPEVYFQFGPGENFIAVGLYRPDKETLFKIRKKIAAQPDVFQHVNEDKFFRSFFPEGIQGEKNKRLPKEWMSVAEKQPLLYNKQFYAIKYFTPDEIVNTDLARLIVSHYQAMHLFNDWLMDL